MHVRKTPSVVTTDPRYKALQSDLQNLLKQSELNSYGKIARVLGLEQWKSTIASIAGGKSNFKEDKFVIIESAVNSYLQERGAPSSTNTHASSTAQPPILDSRPTQEEMPADGHCMESSPPTLEEMAGAAPYTQQISGGDHDQATEFEYYTGFPSGVTPSSTQNQTADGVTYTQDIYGQKSFSTGSEEYLIGGKWAYKNRRGVLEWGVRPDSAGR